MGSKIKLTDTSGIRIPKKQQPNQVDLSVSNSELLLNESPVVGGGNPGGIDKQVQFNDNGIFGTSSSFVYNKSKSNFFVSCESYVGGGSYFSSSVGGRCNIIGGESNYSSSNGGQNNRISSYSSWSSSNGGKYNILSASSVSAIIGGQNNCITNSDHASINGGLNEIINNSPYSSIIGGQYNQICSASRSSIIGGNNHYISASSRSVIIGGNGLALNNQDDTVLVPNMIINGSLNFLNLPYGDPFIPGTLYYTGNSIFISVAPSDFRFKNILQKLHTTPEGINIYSYIYKNYVGIEGIFQGVIAQELMGSPYEDALIKFGNYFYVNYYKLPNVDFKRID